MIVKVCGMRDAVNIRQLEALGIDWMGMIFWPKSKRYVSMPPVYLPQHVRKVGVFVDASLDAIRQHVEDYQLDIVQLHGQESPDMLKVLKPLTLIKALNIATPEDLQKNGTLRRTGRLFPIRHERKIRGRQWREIRLVGTRQLSGRDSLPAQWRHRT